MKNTSFLFSFSFFHKLLLLLSFKNKIEYLVLNGQVQYRRPKTVYKYVEPVLYTPKNLVSRHRARDVTIMFLQAREIGAFNG